MSNLALYRKHRSSSFAEVLGQDHITQTLVQALESNRIGHAYLFTGPRGVGKTTVARLLARSLNCVGTVSGSQRPCNDCATCKLDTASNFDIIEIDAASNRRIDEIRELRDKIGLAPALGKHKVYIIDEVHMLTTEAFNALLKTLEEPPAHVVFILATTEAHKVPATIVSRTQRFSFKPLPVAQLADGLTKIASHEKIKAAPEAMEILADAASGSFRDAISLLDQAASSGRQLTADSVRQLLGWSNHEVILKLSQSLAKADAKSALTTLDQAIGQGGQPGPIADQLVTLWRQILRAGVGLTGASDATAQLAKAVPAERSAAIIDRLLAIGRSPQPQLALEAALVEICGPASQPAAEAPVGPVQASPKPAAASPAPPAQSAAPSDASQRWLKALSLIKQRNNSLYALLRSCDTQFQANQLQLTCRFNFHRDRLDESKNRQAIEEALAQAFGQQFIVKTTLEQTPIPAPSTGQELVSSAMEIFGGEVID